MHPRFDYPPHYTTVTKSHPLFSFLFLLGESD
jgi:hypothetical protein